MRASFHPNHILSPRTVSTGLATSRRNKNLGPMAEDKKADQDLQFALEVVDQQRQIIDHQRKQIAKTQQ